MEELVFKGKEGQVLTNSLLVAEKFGKKHYHVTDAIKNLLNSHEKSGQFFVPSTYIDASGKENPMYVMNRDGFTLLVMGFTGEKALGFKLDYIDAFNKMENALKEGKILSEPKQPKPVSARTLQLMKLDTAKWLIKNLNYSDTGKLALAKAIADPLELPVPVYAKSKGVIHSATDKLKERGISLSARKFNKMMIEAGMMELASRHSRSKGKDITWPVLIGDGLLYGENGVHPNNPRQTQPSYYDHNFDELLSILRIVK